MPTFIILSRLSPEALRDPRDLPKLADKVAEKIKRECPAVEWKNSFATLGRFDIVDIVESDDPQQVERAAMLIRSYGHATTETLPATSWKDFLNRLSS